MTMTISDAESVRSTIPSAASRTFPRPGRRTASPSRRRAGRPWRAAPQRKDQRDVERRQQPSAREQDFFERQLDHASPRKGSRILRHDPRARKRKSARREASMPIAIAATKIIALGLKKPMSTTPGAGQTPAKPQPTPKIAAPTTSGASIACAFGRSMHRRARRRGLGAPARTPAPRPRSRRP